MTGAAVHPAPITPAQPTTTCEAFTCVQGCRTASSCMLNSRKLHSQQQLVTGTADPRPWGEPTHLLQLRPCAQPVCKGGQCVVLPGSQPSLHACSDLLKVCSKGNQQAVALQVGTAPGEGGVTGGHLTLVVVVAVLGLAEPVDDDTDSRYRRAPSCLVGKHAPAAPQSD